MQTPVLGSKNGCSHEGIFKYDALLFNKINQNTVNYFLYCIVTYQKYNYALHPVVTQKFGLFCEGLGYFVKS